MGGVTAIMGGMSALTSTFGELSTTAATSFGTVDAILVSGTALLASFTAQAAEAYGEFEQGMKIVQTVSGQTGYAIDELTNKANEMSIAYRTSIGDITDGLQTLGRAGLNSAETQLEVLESGLQTAKLEGRALNGVLEEIIQNTAMLGGDLKSVDFGAQSEYLNSRLVATSMTAPITSHDISQTLQYAGGTAAAAGANLESAEGKRKLDDLLGTVAAFAQKGVTGSMAGTALRAFFTKPASQDKSVTAGLEAIGLTADDLWEDGGESMKSVSDQIGIIQRQMDSLNMSTMDQIEIWGKIVGAKMGQQMMKLDSSTIKDLTRDIENANSAENLAAQTLQTYTQKLSEMQQQGDLAFRQIGSKAVVFLTPVVEIITKILGLLSTPEGSIATFTAIGAIMYYGIQKAWNMIVAVKNQFQALLGDVARGVEAITGQASGIGTGFATSAANVDVLNAKLAETNSELALMQAQFMGIKGVTSTGTYVAPLGLTDKNGQLPKGMISTAKQNVYVGNKGVGEKGTYYDPSDKAKLEEAYRKSMQERNVAYNKKLDEYYSKAVRTDARGQTHYYDPESKNPNRFISKEQFEKNQAAYVAAHPILSDKQINANITSAFKEGSQEIHSSMVSMSSSEYNKWMAGLKNSSDPLKQFNYKRQKELERHAGDKATNVVDGQKYHRVVQFNPVQKRFNEYERLLQKEAQFKQFEQKRADLTNERRAQLSGRRDGITAGLRSTGRQVQNKGIELWNKQLTKSRGYISSFGNAVRRVVPGMSNISAQMGAKVNALIDSIEPKLVEGTIGVEEALLMLKEETGLTSAELSVLLEDVTMVSGEFTNLQQKLAGLATTTQADMVAEEGHIQAVLADEAATEVSAMTKAKEAFAGGLKSLAGYMGGPVMIAMMGFTMAMQAIQQNQQAWQERMQEATSQISEAADNLTQAQDKIKENYSAENDRLTEADLDKAVDSQYAAVYDAFYSGVNADRTQLEQHSSSTDLDMSGPGYNKETNEYELLTEDEIDARNEAVSDIEVAKDENVQALNENTMQLAAATAAYSQGIDNAAKEFRDGTWGFDSFTAGWSDQLGEWQEEIWNVGASLMQIDAREGFFDSNSPVLSASQKDSNYAGSTEFAPIFMADVYRFGTNKGAEQVFGSDFDRIYGLMASMDNKISTKYQSELSGQAAMSAHAANFASVGPNAVDAKTMSTMQMSMKENKSDYQRLAKQMFRQEQSHGFKSTAYNDYLKASGMVSKGQAKNFEEAMKKIKGGKLTVQDKNLHTTIKKLMAMTGNKLSEANILAMGQLQQLQDMYTVANETVAPGIMQTVQGVYQNVSATGTAAGNAGTAAGGAVSAGNNAAAIAAVLGAQAQSAAEGYAYDKWKRTDQTTIDGIQIKNQEDFVKALAKQGPEAQKWESEVLQTLSGSGWSVNHPGATPDEIKKNSERLAGEGSELMKSNASYQDKLNTATSMLTNYMTGAIQVAYDQSDIGEYGGGARDVGSGQGGGGDDGGSDSGSDKGGTKKSRVDLVLCNKKEIPKLNVNLFKTPPNFTILNKNFKLRDIKINSQDKPQAIMAALKNGIIETQKRMDPKIIQDETGEYDPLAATEGKATPSGTTKTSSN